MPDVKVPFGFETRISSDWDHDLHRVTGYKADVMLNNVQVFTRHYRNADHVLGVWMKSHPRPPVGEAQVQWYRDYAEVTKGTVKNDLHAEEQVLTDFANRLALTLTWPDGA